MKERESNRQAEETKRLAKEKSRNEQLAKDLEQEKKKSINPLEMFKNETDKYSQWDPVTGLPTLTVDGLEVSKGQIKKLVKIQEQQKKKYEEHQRSVAANGANGN
jgi:hypothetical protein